MSTTHLHDNIHNGSFVKVHNNIEALLVMAVFAQEGYPPHRLNLRSGEWDYDDFSRPLMVLIEGGTSSIEDLLAVLLLDLPNTEEVSLEDIKALAQEI